MGEILDDLFFLLVVLKLRNKVNIFVEELGNEFVGFVIYVFFNQVVRIEEVQKLGCFFSIFIVQVVFIVVVKVVLELGGEDLFEGFGNGIGNLFEMLDIRGDVIEGFWCRKLKFLNMGFEFIVDELVCVRRIKSELELRLLEISEKGRIGELDLRISGIGDNLFEFLIFMIVSVDGVVVFYIFRCGSLFLLILLDD